MILCPIITYGSVVWWSRTRLNTAELDLDKIQRMVCVAMSGCIRTTPTASLELLLGLHPLYMRIEAEALICMKRLKNLGHWKDYSRYLSWGDLNSNVLTHPFFDMPSDGLLCRFTFDRPYEVLFPSRDDWNKVPSFFKDHGIIWYTDGSKLDKYTGAGVCCLSDGTKSLYPLGRYSTVFQAEVFAILMCCKTCLDRDYRNRYIYIC